MLKKVAFYLLVVSGIAGLIVCFKAMAMGVDCPLGLLESDFCKIGTGDASSCTSAICGSWGKIFGVSNGTWGAVYHVVLLAVWASALFAKNRRERIMSFLFFQTIFGVSYAVFMATLLTFVVKVPCPICIGFYITAVVNVILAFVYTRKISEGGAAGRFRLAILFIKEGVANMKVWAVAALCLAVSAAMIYGAAAKEKETKKKVEEINKKQSEIEKTEKVEKADHSPDAGGKGSELSDKEKQKDIDRMKRMWGMFLSEPLPKELIPSDSGLVMGSPNGKTTLYIFTDFECPFCVKMEKALKDVTEQVKDLKVVRKDYPLDHHCNPLLKGRRFHQASCDAAYFARCAAAGGADYWKVSDKLHEKYRELEDDSTFKSIAEEMGLKFKTIETCMKDPSNDAHIKTLKDVEEGLRLKLDGTPTMLINDRLIVLPAGPKELIQIIKLLNGQTPDYKPPLPKDAETEFLEKEKALEQQGK